jgi:hypothetical protein
LKLWCGYGACDEISGRQHRDLFYLGIAMGLAGGREPCVFTEILFRRIGCGVSPDHRGDISSVSRTFASSHVPLARGLAGSRLFCRFYRAKAQTKKLRFERSQLPANSICTRRFAGTAYSETNRATLPWGIW